MAEMEIKLKTVITVSPESEKMRSSFWRGFIVSTFFSAMTQDWMGLDRYIEATKAGWRQYPFWIWAIAIVAFLVWQGWMEREHRRLVALLDPTDLTKGGGNG